MSIEVNSSQFKIIAAYLKEMSGRAEDTLDIETLDLAASLLDSAMLGEARTHGAHWPEVTDDWEFTAEGSIVRGEQALLILLR